MNTKWADLETPLPGVPISLDLLNTQWVDDEPVDVLTTTEGVESWLHSHDFDFALAPLAKEPLRVARAAIRTAVDSSGYEAVNEVLSHARMVITLDEQGLPVESVIVEDDAWRPPVMAALNLIELIREDPDRIRVCEHPACVLWFFDSTRNRSRRWCSMADCGNRAKAKRHYQRNRRR